MSMNRMKSKREQKKNVNVLVIDSSHKKFRLSIAELKDLKYLSNMDANFFREQNQ